MAENMFRLQIISPDRIFYDGEAKMLEMVTTEGEVGIYKGHIPMTNVLKPGIVTIHEENGIKRAAVHEGFVEILPDEITIMAEVAEWPDEIDVNRAKEAEGRAQNRIKSQSKDIDVARAEAALKRALTRIELVERYK